MSNHINSIAGMNVKGRNFRHELKPLTIIFGDNATGKTAITDAIQIALMGYHPALGKKAGATMDLAPDTAKQMEVEATFSEGGKVRRSFTRTRTGASLETIGEAPEIPAAQMNFAEFLSAKPTERHTILASLMGEIDYAALADRTKAQMASLGILDVVEVQIDPQADKPLEAAIATLADDARQMKQTVDQNRKTLASMAMVEQPTKVQPEEMAQAEQALATANETVGKNLAELDQLNREIAQSPDEPNEPEPTDGDLSLMENQTSAAQQAVADGKANTGILPELETRLHTAETRHAILAPIAANILPTPPQETHEEIASLRVKIEAEIKDASQPIIDLTGRIGGAQGLVSSASEQLKQLQHGTCPCCGNTGSALEAAMEAMVKRQTEATAAWKAATSKRTELEKTVADLGERLRELQDMERQITAWQAATEQGELEKEIGSLRERLAACPDMQALEAALVNHQRKQQKALALANEWQHYREAKIPTKEQLAAALAAHNDAKHARESVAAALTQMRATNAGFDAWQAEKNRAVTIQDDTDKLEKTAKAIGELRTFLLEQQRDAVAESMRPMIETAGIFLRGLVPGEMATRGHLVGIQRGEQFLPLEVLSGMEMVAVSAACQAALASKGTHRILIIDELARMTPVNRLRFIANCEDAIRTGVIDQAILIDQTAPDSKYSILV